MYVFVMFKQNKCECFAWLKRGAWNIQLRLHMLLGKSTKILCEIKIKLKEQGESSFDQTCVFYVHLANGSYIVHEL